MFIRYFRSAFARRQLTEDSRKRLGGARLSVEMLEDRLAPSYTVIDLGPPDVDSAAYAINNAGQVVGAIYSHWPFSFANAFRWDATNGMQSLDWLTPFGSSEAYDINDAGQIVGAAETETGWHPVLWENGTVPIDLGAQGDGTSSFGAARAINEAGQVVGYDFLWTAGSGIQSLNLALADGINEVGEIVGSSAVDGVAAFRDAGGELTYLGTFPGDDVSQATDINDAGQVVGWSGWPVVGMYSAFIWQDGVMTQVGPISGSQTESIANAVNNEGQVVGTAFEWNQSNRAAWIWQDGHIANLNGMIPANSGWILNSAEDINDIGQIVGYGTINGQTHAFLLTPDADPQLPRLSIDDLTVTELHAGSTAVAFTVTLSAASSQPVTVDYTTVDDGATAGSDYQASSATLTFAPGQTSKTITVLVNGDRLGEANETFVVNLSNPNNATIADGQAVGTIVDDEPRVSISDVGRVEGRKGQTVLFTFTVTLLAAYDQPVTMSFQTVNGTATTSNNDYIARTGTLTFAPAETTKTITIEVKGDSKREGNETFYLDLFGISSNSLLVDGRGIGTILNDD